MSVKKHKIFHVVLCQPFKNFFVRMLLDAKFWVVFEANNITICDLKLRAKFS